MKKRLLFCFLILGILCGLSTMGWFTYEFVSLTKLYIELYKIYNYVYLDSFYFSVLICLILAIIGSIASITSFIIIFRKIDKIQPNLQKIEMRKQQKIERLEAKISKLKGE